MDWLRRHPLRVALPAVALIAWLDHATGVEIRIYPLYFLPIALAAWYGPPGTGWWMPLATTVAWSGSNALSGASRWGGVVWGINTVTQAISFLTIGLLIRELRRRLERERDLSRHDPLTGLRNRRAFHEHGELLAAAAARAGQPLTLAFLDLDNFKHVNDSAGHLEGDRVLRAVADVLRERLRGSDLAARLGGDEFALLLPNTGAPGAQTLLERVRAGVGERMHAERWPVTVSVGAIVYACAPATLEEGLKRADRLMYTAKGQGKNRVYLELAEAERVPPADADGPADATDPDLR
jgi:diguanylate cyclase (GGDEF)-like protein